MKASIEEQQDYATEVDGIDMEIDMHAPLEGEVLRWARNWFGVPKLEE